jgi:site-specific recombinase XerD
MRECEDVAEADKDAIAELMDALDPDQLTTTFVNEDSETETKSTNTLRTYVYGLKRVGEVSDTRLVDMDATDVNELMGALREGRVDHPNAQSDGYSKSYLKPWQAALRAFYRYHEDMGVTSNEIVIFTQDKTTVDDRDMYTQEEIEALRSAVDNARDKCMLELFLNTGQRIRAIQTLRIKDVHPNEGSTGVYYLNTDAEGLKGAEQNGSKRPLLGAKRAVYDWLQYHPKSDDPEAYLITPRREHAWATPGEQLSQSTIRKTLKKLADKAEVTKPPNPHNFRHYFVTTCKRHYGMDDSTIKHLIGHGEGSQVMETTYSHLTDEDMNKDAEVSFGAREEEEESPFTPPVCPTCSNTLEPNAKACGGCGTVFAPNAKAAQDEIEGQIRQANRETHPDDEGTAEELDAIEQALEDPEIKKEVTELLMEKLSEN